MNTRQRKARMTEINTKLIELREENATLRDDLSRIKDSVETGSKLDSYESTDMQKLRQYYDLKDIYPAFFESDSEGEKGGPSSRPGKVMEIKRYIRKELSINEKAIARLENEGNNLQELIQSNYLPNSRQEKELLAKGKSPKQDTEPAVSGEGSGYALQTQGESSKRKSDSLGESDDSSSSKKNKETPSDFIDSLPELPYNPFDD